MKIKILWSSYIVFLLVVFTVFQTFTFCSRTVDIPNISGMTVKGWVHCEGAGIPGVVVSDGYEVTTTDNHGVYHLPSEKKHGYVFVSVPGNYEVTNINNIPQFFKQLSRGASVERHDFQLIQADNTKHVVIAMADWHLADKYGDLSQFTNNFVPDVNAVIKSYQGQEIKVYGLALGDMSYERYWYTTGFGLPEYLNYITKLDCPIFNVIGNHDHDPYCEGDWLAENTYRKVVGPTYYSFNLGGVHYIVLDNIEYLNTGATHGSMGKRDYNGVIVPDQIKWLKKDLATIRDKTTPVVIAMHIPLYEYPVFDSYGEQRNRISLNNGDELLSAFQDFSDVHILSGHRHVNSSAEPTDGLMEHNIAAVSAAWWRTGEPGFAGNHICRDGSPGGYSVWEVDGREIEWYYKSIGYERAYQFRSYDLNRTYITNEKYAPNSTYPSQKYAQDYAYPNNKNEVLINVWGYDSQWKIEVKEHEKSLKVSRVTAFDPLFIISHTAKYYDKGAKPYKNPFNGANIFKVKASGSATTLEITVTDRFGNVYSETMVRPKELSYLMK